jgi:hypothetical protein
MEKLGFSDLKKIVEIKPKLNYNKFDDWFNNENVILDDEDIIFLKNLIDKNIFYLENYKEEDLKVKTFLYKNLRSQKRQKILNRNF